MLPKQQHYGKFIPVNSPNNIPVNLPPYPTFSEACIDLNTHQKAGIRNIINNKEKIFYAGVVPKVNQEGVVQERILVITNRFVYNIDQNEGFLASLSLCSSSGFVVKRKIHLHRVDAVTLNINPVCEKQQFIIHVRGEHDYLYNGRIARERIIKSLFNAHFYNTLDPIGLYLRSEKNLSKFQTSEKDVKKRKNKRPLDGLLFINAETASRGVEWIIFNRVFLANMTRPVQRASTPQPINIQYPVYSPTHNPNQGIQVRFPSSGYQAPYAGPGYGNAGQAQPNLAKPQYFVPEPQNKGSVLKPEDFNNSSYPLQGNANQVNHQQQQVHKAPSYQNLEQTIPQLYAAPNNNVQINSFAPLQDPYKAHGNGQGYRY